MDAELPLSVPFPSIRPLRLCFVTSDYPTDAAAAGGGIGAHAYALAHAVASLGHEVVILTAIDGPAREYCDGPILVHALRRPFPRYAKLGRLIPVPWVRRSFAVWWALRQLHRRQPLDFVRFPDAYAEGCRFSYTPFAPYSIHLHGANSLLQKWDRRAVPPVRARVESWLEQRPARHAPLLVVATQSFADLMATEWSLDRTRIKIIRNPIDTAKFRPASLHQPSSRRTVLFVGHLQMVKGLTTLALAIPRVIAIHPDVHFAIVGDDTQSAPGGGSMRRHVEEVLAAAGALGSVSFQASMRHEELVDFYRDCTALVLPSSREAYGNVVIEAMACGRPCVVTSAVGAAELIVNGRTGFVVHPDDPDALATAIAKLLTMPADAREEMGRAARLVVERNNAGPVIAAQTIEAFREVIALRGGAVHAITGSGQ